MVHRTDHDRILPDSVDPKFELTLHRARGVLASLTTEAPQIGGGDAPLHDVGPVRTNGITEQFPVFALLARLPGTAASPEHAWIRSAAAMVVLAVRGASDTRYAEAASSITIATRTLRQLIKDTEFRATQDLWPEPTAQESSPDEGNEEPNPAADWQEHLNTWAAAHAADPRWSRVRDIERALAYLVERRTPRAGGARRTGSESGTAPPQKTPPDDRNTLPDPVPEQEVPPAPATPTPSPAPGAGGEPGSGGSGGGPGSDWDADELEPDGERMPRHGRNVLGGRQVAAIRSAAQDLPGIDRHPVQAGILRVALEGHRTLAALTACCLYSGERGFDAVAVAHRPSDVDLQCQTLWVVIQPLGLVIPNLVSETLPGPPPGRDSPMPARAIIVPLRAQMPGARALRMRAACHLHRSFRDQGRVPEADEKRATTVPLFSQDDIRVATRQLRVLAAPRRITLAWASNLQPWQFDQLFGGITEHTLVQRVRVDPAYRAAAHYRQIQPEEAAWQRTIANDRIEAWVNGHPVPDVALASPGPGEGQPEHLHPAGVLGSLRVPDGAEVRAWVANMKTRMGAVPRGRPTPPSVVAFHNKFVVYAMQLLLWSTGARMSRAALSQLAAGGGPADVVLHDKGTQGGARLALLPPMARAQMGMLRTHMRWVTAFAGWTHPTNPAVLIDDELRPIPLQPGQLHKLSGSNLVNNAHRHALPQALRERGIRDDRVALILGHRRPGADPADPWSMMPPGPSQDEIVAAQAHLERCGFEALAGFRGRNA